MIWLNGSLVSEAKIDASSAGITLGWGVFRTLGVVDGKPRFFARHFERLCEDASAAQLEFAFPREVVWGALEEVLRANTISDGLARLTLTQRGDGRWNTQNGADFSIFAVQNETANAPARVQLSPYRVEAKRPLSGVKTTSYLPSLWAWREAKRSGFDEAILLDGTGFLSEGARSTLVWVKNSEIFTPSFETGCLHGVGRDLVLEWAASRSIPVHEGTFGVEHAKNAEELWLVSAASGARIVASWDANNGAPCQEFPLDCSLQRAFQLWWNMAKEAEF